ncbi:hypothetical protein ACS0TY_020469 [Phlomoides rotata]
MLTPNKVIWHFSNNGSYTVKSAYKAASTLVINDGIEGKVEWKKLWNLKIPPKLKSWYWRVCRNFLPTRERLWEKGLHISPICVMCQYGVETS